MAKERTEADKKIFIGEWKDIPKKNFLTSLPEGRYFLQSHKVIKLMFQAKLLAANEAISEGDKEIVEHQPSTPLTWLEDDDIGRSFVKTVTKLSKQINMRIDDLDGKPGGGDDKMLEEMFEGLDGLLATAYDQYIQIQPSFWKDNNRQHMIIDIEKAPGLLYNGEDPYPQQIESKLKQKSKSSSSKKDKPLPSVAGQVSKSKVDVPAEPVFKIPERPTDLQFAVRHLTKKLMDAKRARGAGAKKDKATPKEGTGKRKISQNDKSVVEPSRKMRSKDAQRTG